MCTWMREKKFKKRNDKHTYIIGKKGGGEGKKNILIFFPFNIMCVGFFDDSVCLLNEKVVRNIFELN